MKTKTRNADGSLTLSATINNWKPEVSSLVGRLLKAGFRLISCDNGETVCPAPGNGTKLTAAFLDEIIATDECELYVVDPDGVRRWLLLVLGNSPGELISDYSCPSSDAIVDHIEPVAEAHAQKWEGVPQPKAQKITHIPADRVVHCTNCGGSHPVRSICPREVDVQ